VCVCVCVVGPHVPRSRWLPLHLITLKDIYTLGKTPLDEGSAHRRGIYLHNTQRRQETNNHASAGFESAVPASERPQTHALDRSATGIVTSMMTGYNIEVDVTVRKGDV
jgi:hypothetical protein